MKRKKIKKLKNKYKKNLKPKKIAINKQRREKIKKTGKAILTIISAALLSKMAQAGTIDFKSKNQTDNTMRLTDDGKVKIGQGGTLAYYSSAPTLTGTSILGYDGYLYANRVYNSVWNDLADFRSLAKGVKREAGKVYVSTPEGLIIASRRCQGAVAGVCSDTYGFALGGGEDDPGKAPIAVSGWALAFVDKPYSVGTPLVTAKNGILTKANIFEKLFFQERIVGTMENRPEKDQVNPKIKVNGRYWVKI